MSPISPPKIVNGPAVTPSLRGLVASATPAIEDNDGWVGGFTWDPETCAIVNVLPNDCGGDVDYPDPAEFENCVTVLPSMLEVAVIRGTLHARLGSYPTIPLRILEAGTTKALEADFWTGVGSRHADSGVVGNQYLASPDATVVNPTPGTAVPLRQGLALLEQALADCGVGGRGMIHAPVEVASLWTYDSSAFVVDGDQLVTLARGNILVAGAGYPGTGPDSESTPTEHTFTGTGGITGGTYTLTVLGATTAPIVWDANALDVLLSVQVAVEQTDPTFDIDSITVTGGPLETAPIVVSYPTVGPVQPASADASQLTGTAPAIDVATTEGDVVTPAATPAAGTAWVYATGQVQTRLSLPEITPDEFKEAFDRKTNTVSYRAWRHAAANFDPCCGPFAVLVSLYPAT
ncbi:hypothetical protein [Desertimonas flava]|uniref:hypothetical protein n=1 Tax=Desertimonas flava TaxID=2064846 RepID=UPI000E350288|nr:hypothetical protein [Desertimonas flava]